MLLVQAFLCPDTNMPLSRRDFLLKRLLPLVGGAGVAFELGRALASKEIRRSLTAFAACDHFSSRDMKQL
jgi:hypothetical protein